MGGAYQIIKAVTAHTALTFVGQSGNQSVHYGTRGREIAIVCAKAPNYTISCSPTQFTLFLQLRQASPSQ